MKKKRSLTRWVFKNRLSGHCKKLCFLIVRSFVTIQNYQFFVILQAFQIQEVVCMLYWKDHFVKKKTLLLSILHTCNKNKEKPNKLTTFQLSRFCLECAVAPRNETKGKTSQSIRGKMGGRVKTAKRCERKIDAENLPNTKG